MIFGQHQLDRLRAGLAATRARSRSRWRAKSNLRVLLVADSSKIPRSQIFPFYYFLKDIERRFKTEFREVSVASFQNIKRSTPTGADIVLFQPWFTLGHEKITSLADLLRKSNPGATLIFMDSYAPSDLRFAETLEPFIDLYVKKHVFRDRSLYGKPTQGDTNLVDFYEKLYELKSSPKVTFAVSESFLSKLVVGPTFFTSSYLLPKFHRQEQPAVRTKNIRVHARLGCTGAPWYQSMREHSLSNCEPFAQGSIVTSETTRFGNYINELSRSMVCFSPFGYGEVCIRDYEAIACGTMLIKPDMSHIETSPNVYLPHETYVPIKWDFSDLGEKLDYYLSHENETKEITENAYRLLHNYCRSGGFVDQVGPLFKK